jgi:hypothetical protein
MKKILVAISICFASSAAIAQTPAKKPGAKPAAKFVGKPGAKSSTKAVKTAPPASATSTSPAEAAPASPAVSAPATNAVATERAAPVEAGTKHRYNYGMAGCGVGSLLVEGPERQNDKVFQMVAWLVNQYLGQTYSITSGTSNCTDTPKSVARMEQEVFISANINSMTKEAAQGDGQHLAAFAEVLGCGDAESVAQFAQLSQQRYEVIFANSQPSDVLNRYLAEVKGSGNLADRCTRADL